MPNKIQLFMPHTCILDGGRCFRAEVLLLVHSHLKAQSGLVTDYIVRILDRLNCSNRRVGIISDSKFQRSLIITFLEIL